MPSCKFDVDDRGNVVDFYCNDEQTGRIDREAGDDANSLYAWFSDSATEKWARTRHLHQLFLESLRCVTTSSCIRSFGMSRLITSIIGGCRLLGFDLAGGHGRNE